MKKLMVCLLAVTFAMSLTAFAQQDNSMAQAQSDARKRSKRRRVVRFLAPK